MTEQQINDFATLVYYPEAKLKQIRNTFSNEVELNAWYQQTIYDMITLLPYASSKYTRSKLRKALPEQFVYVIEELLYKSDKYSNKKTYYEKIMQQIITLRQSEKLIIGLAYTIQRLIVDHLHVVGDIYDRGPDPDKIMDTLINYTP